VREPYGRRLQQRVAERGALCAGIDPHPQLLRDWGLTPNARGLERCARTMVEAIGDVVPVFKPQSAFFEAHGSAGIAVLERTLADITGSRALALLDVKRGDIGSTMDAYAAAYLSDGSPLAADAITLSPYLGFGSLHGAIELARGSGRGVYVLALTSNPEGPQVQLAQTSDGRSVARSILEAAATENADVEYGHVGLVVGATVGEAARAGGLDFAALRGPLLAPGFGAQGATVADLEIVFGPAIGSVLPATSRELMAAGPDPAAIRKLAQRTLGRIATAFRVG
jgi:orotidine-5'-phosphate decarboxylase